MRHVNETKLFKSVENDVPKKYKCIFFFKWNHTFIFAYINLPRKKVLEYNVLMSGMFRERYSRKLFIVRSINDQQHSTF